MSHEFTEIPGVRRPTVALRQIGLLFLALVLLQTAACSKKMPNVVGKSQQDATKELEKLNLTIQTTTQQTGKPPGTVIDQEPKAKEKLPENKTVSLVVEAGGGAGGAGTAAPSGQPAAGVAVPLVEGKSLADAIGQIATAGLKVTIRKVETTDQRDIVLELNPRGGTIVAPDTEVVVSVPDTLVTVPSVTGMEQVQAVVQLTLKGLKVGPARSQIEGQGAVGSVVDQIPKPNERVAIGTAIQLTVKGAAVTIPRVTETDFGVASSNITGAGLVPAAQYDETSNKPAGIVILQRPNPGVSAAPGSEVILTVAGKQPINIRPGIRLYETIKPSTLILRDLPKRP